MFSARQRTLPSHFMSGFGQDTTVTDWISTIFQPIADVAKKYYDLQTGQYTPQAQKVVHLTTLPSIASISPIYLIGGGLLIWYLFKGGGIKGEEGRRRKSYKRR